MIRLSTLAAAALIALCACNGGSMDPVSKDPNPKGTKGGDDTPLAIRSGTFFGMCRGYCLREATITPSAVTFLEYSRDSVNYPVKSKTIQITDQEWDDLTAAFRQESFAALDSVIGCPDCADGGGEWIEIETGSMRRKVTFEHGAAIPSIAPLVEKVRALRERGKG